MAEVKESGEMKCGSCLLFDCLYSIYVGYLPFRATKVSGRRREEIRGNMLLLAVKRANALT